MMVAALREQTGTYARGLRVVPKLFRVPLLGSNVGLRPPPTCLARRLRLRTDALGREHSPLLVGDELEESCRPARRCARRARSRRRVAAPPNNTHADRRGFLTDALAHPSRRRVTSARRFRGREQFDAQAVRTSPAPDPRDPRRGPPARASRAGGRISRRARVVTTSADACRPRRSLCSRPPLRSRRASAARRRATRVACGHARAPRAGRRRACSPPSPPDRRRNTAAVDGRVSAHPSSPARRASRPRGG